MTVAGLWKVLIKKFEQALTERDLDVPQFVQDNHSFSQKVYCAVCIISLIRMRKENWYVWYKAERGM